MWTAGRETAESSRAHVVDTALDMARIEVLFILVNLHAKPGRQYRRFAPNKEVRAHLVPNCRAQLAAQLSSHALSSADGSHTPGLGDTDGTGSLWEVGAAISSLQQELRHLSGLAAPRLTTQHLHSHAERNGGSAGRIC
jgi:hypothetical protein